MTRRRTVGRPPAVAVVIAIAGLVLFFALPVVGLLVRAPWGGVVHEMSSHAVITASLLSLLCSACATALSIAFGVPLAWLLARGRFFGRRVVRALIVLPIVLPPVVGGVALLLAFDT